MFSAFRDRRPWAAATISLVFGPFIGMLCLNRGYLAAIYFGMEIVAVVAGVMTLLSLPAQLTNPNIVLLFSLPVTLAGAVHAHRLARTRPVAEPRRWYSHLYALVLIFLAFPAAALAIRTFLFQPFDTPSSSMSPTLNVGDYFFVTKFAYIDAAPQRGDLIVLRAAQDSRTVSFVKRIAAVPGDRIQLVGGIVYINGVAAKLKRVRETMLDCRFGQCISVPEFVEWLPGSNGHRILQASTDGQLDNIPTVIIPPGSYYVLGDNRDNSNDSRLDLGFIAAQNIVGRVAIKLFDGQQHRVVWQSVN